MAIMERAAGGDLGVEVPNSKRDFAKSKKQLMRKQTLWDNRSLLANGADASNRWFRSRLLLGDEGGN